MQKPGIQSWKNPVFFPKSKLPLKAGFGNLGKNPGPFPDSTLYPINVFLRGEKWLTLMHKMINNAEFMQNNAKLMQT